LVVKTWWDAGERWCADSHFSGLKIMPLILDLFWVFPFWEGWVMVREPSGRRSVVLGHPGVPGERLSLKNSRTSTKGPPRLEALLNSDFGGCRGCVDATIFSALSVPLLLLFHITLSLLECMAGTTGLEPATSAVTGQRSNQLSYVPRLFFNNLVICHIESSASQLSLFSTIRCCGLDFGCFWTPKRLPQQHD